MLMPRTVWNPPNQGFVDPAPPGEEKRCHPWIRNTCMHLQLQQTGDENGAPRIRYRPASRENPKLGFVEPAPPGVNKVSPPNHESSHKCRVSSSWRTWVCVRSTSRWGRHEILDGPCSRNASAVKQDVGQAVYPHPPPPKFGRVSWGWIDTHSAEYE